ncbi:MAG: Uncharacterized protein Athens071426_9 [Parcubacteria group bacterium Athens0714_26]|nr:MAG: Uncharacterized protein Athens101426_233 [Parcubacteria group bacterium Athens1014_26]TSD03802.1 MAG: Uncharacterized protein Athens071426_9 [Parcubacteria group bacterium Athens0714_26]
MKTILIIIISIVMIVIGIQLYKLYEQKLSLEKSVSDLSREINSVSEENYQLQADLNYFSNPQNLEKELRGRLNYKKPGEKLMIIVPPKAN